MRASIVFETLPPRVRPVAADEVAAVFGGCANSMEVCKDDCDCCFGLTCSAQSPQTGLTYCIQFK